MIGFDGSIKSLLLILRLWDIGFDEEEEEETGGGGGKKKDEATGKYQIAKRLSFLPLRAFIHIYIETKRRASIRQDAVQS